MPAAKHILRPPTAIKLSDKRGIVVAEKKMIRAADAKEVGVGNPAEETYRYPNLN